jgi:hypothetical protein
MIPYTYAMSLFFLGIALGGLISGFMRSGGGRRRE